MALVVGSNPAVSTIMNACEECGQDYDLNDRGVCLGCSNGPVTFFG